MNNDTFVYVLHINATAEQVWNALTQPEFTQKYWGGRRIESDWQVGSSFKHIRPDGVADVQGEILEADKPRVLSYTWTAEGRKPSRVTFKLQYQEPNTRLMLTHEGLEVEPKLENMITEGWSAILSNLKTLLERGEPMSFPWWREESRHS
jgi:uncharacterized protein YndB with AHSA1/START domain